MTEAKLCESGCVHVGDDNVARDCNGQQIGMRSGDVIDFRTMGNPYGLAFAASSVKPPRAPHPMFGPVPRGFVALDWNMSLPLSPDGPFHSELLAWDQIVRVEVHESFPKDCGITDCSVWTKTNSGMGMWERYPKQTAAEVSRLIAEAQGDE